MKKVHALVADDESGMLKLCEESLRSIPGVCLTLERDADKVIDCLNKGSYDLLIAEASMPTMNGIDLLRKARKMDPNLLIVVVTAHPSVEDAVETMKLGGADYITKPLHPGDLLEAVKRLLEARRLKEESRLLRRQIQRSHTYSFGEMLGKSPPMQQVFETIHHVADTDVDVLIIGDTGTGKELVARSLHHRSPRRDKPFVPVDCGAIPEALMESEFFGHEKGAFTDAQRRNIGLLEYADEGTLFLDEIGQLPLILQAKLLRALQERAIRRLGSNRHLSLNVRVVAATSLDLANEVKAGRFRRDLYYRINVARIDLPPLRMRQEDIPLMVKTFVDRFASEMNRGQVSFTPEAIEVLCAYTWPGNVRELQNVLKRSLAMVRKDKVEPEDLPDEILESAGFTENRKTDGFFAERSRHMAKFEQEYLTRLLIETAGDVSRAAREAGIPRGTLYRLLKNHRLVPEDFRSDAIHHDI